MADILALRDVLRAATAQLNVAQARLDGILAEIENAQGDLPPQLLQRLRAEAEAQTQIVQRDTANAAAASDAYKAAVLADPMHAVDPGLPLVLLPVRIETAYLPGAAGTDLVVRVYPDDIHVDSHEPELTATELAAGTAFWQAAWGAGPNQARLDAAWNLILATLKPLRAAWTVHVLTPAVPRPADETPADQPQPAPPLPAPPMRPGTFNRAARTMLLPDHWHVIAFQGGQELFNVDGSPIPDSLDVSFGPPGTGAPDSDLPFQAESRWLVDLDAAIAAGMAVRIPLTAPNVPIDQLFVVGVNSTVAGDDAAARLQSAFIAHQYTNGLAFLPPGTPTNNTPGTRSAWESAPHPPSLTEVETAQAAFQSGSNQNAAVAAGALGLDGSVALCVAPDALTDQRFAPALMMQHFWPALGDKALSLLYTNWVIPPGGGPANGSWVMKPDFVQSQNLEDHAFGWVRSRGTLPIMRIGNQPYGLLPALSLDDWVPAADEPTAVLLSWLRTLRDYWLAAVANVPRVLVGGDPNADNTVVNALSRVPVCASIMLRRDGDPTSLAVGSQSLPLAPIPGLPTTSRLFLSVPGDNAQPLTVPVVTDPAGDKFVLLTFQSMFHDGLAVIQGTMTTADYQAKYKGVFGSKTFPGAPPPDLFISMLQDSFADPLLHNDANFAGSMAGFIICLALFFDPTKPDQQKAIQDNLPGAIQFSAQFDVLCTLDASLYESAFRETLDAFSHRLDAWITSLAARRLDSQRKTKPSGLVLGAYGWVEDLAPRTDLTSVTPPPAGFADALSSPLQKYIHAPSMQHAASAAVLRAGYESHEHPDALAVNLVSSRVRLADWLASGVRNGQTVGALLGYRFERGLHEATLDAFIAPLRANFGIPTPSGADNDVNGGAAKTTQAARNVVDGLALYHNQAGVVVTLQNDPDAGPLFTDAARTTVLGLLADLTNALDAFGDLLLAESVHHAVGGSPLRAGLAADTVGGGPIPDRFDVVTTPRSGRALTWQIGALLPAAFVSPVSGWNTDRPRAKVEPHLNAWVATILGPANSWRVNCSITSSGATVTQPVTLDALAISPLDVVAEISGDPSPLEERIVEFLAHSQPADAVISVLRTASTDGNPAFAELLGLVQRIQTVLGKAIPIGPQQLQGGHASAVDGLDVAELDSRAGVFQSSFAAAVQGLSAATQALQSALGADGPTVLTAVQSIRTAMIGLADHGIPAAWPSAPGDNSSASVATLLAQGLSLVAATQPLAAESRPTAPAAGADDSELTAWLSATAEYVKGIAHLGSPLIPTFLLPAGSDYAAAFAPGAAPAGGDVPAAMLWLRRTARVRAGSGALHDVLMASETLQGSSVSLTLAQLPSAAGDQWIGLPFTAITPPAARLALVLSTPAPIDPSIAFCGFVCDTWTEHVPGLTTVASGARGYEASEITGMSFTVETPAAFAPQSILLAAIPDQTLTWSLDILLDTLRETLDLAKIRAVDIGDLPRLGRVIPAIHSGYNVDQTLQRIGVTP